MEGKIRPEEAWNKFIEMGMLEAPMHLLHWEEKLLQWVMSAMHDIAN